MSGPTMAGSKTHPLAKCQLSRAPRMLVSMLVKSFLGFSFVGESERTVTDIARCPTGVEFVAFERNLRRRHIRDFKGCAIVDCGQVKCPACLCRHFFTPLVPMLSARTHQGLL